MPLNKWAEECMSGRHNLRSASKARDESLLRNHIISSFGQVPLAQIRKAHVQKWIARLKDKGYSPRTIQECYRLLGGIMAEAVDHKLIPESPCRRVSLPRTERVEQRFLSPLEVEQLVTAFDPYHQALIYTAVYLGCRWEELAALKRKNLDLLRRQVKIAATIERVGGTYRYVEETKSSASRRTLRLPDFLVEILARHLEVAAESVFVFPARQGGHLRYDNFRLRVWTPAVQRAGLAPLTFQELRHTAAAIMIDQGADPLQVQKRLGHKDIRTTFKHYGHLFPNREDELNEALSRVYRGAKDSSSVGFSWDSTASNVVELPKRESE
jgi:integrase